MEFPRVGLETDNFGSVKQLGVKVTVEEELTQQTETLRNLQQTRKPKVLLNKNGSFLNKPQGFIFRPNNTNFSLFPWTRVPTLKEDRRVGTGGSLRYLMNPRYLTLTFTFHSETDMSPAYVSKLLFGALPSCFPKFRVQGTKDSTKP